MIKYFFRFKNSFSKSFDTQKTKKAAPFGNGFQAQLLSINNV
jgi:hypothetical protein